MEKRSDKKNNGGKVNRMPQALNPKGILVLETVAQVLGMTCFFSRIWDPFLGVALLRIGVD